MKKNLIKGNITNIILTAVVLLALIGISKIQYSWLKSSGERDILDMYRNLNFTIHKSLSYELGSSLFNNDNQNFLDSYNGDDGEYKLIIEEVFNSINTDLGEKYISSIGFVTNNNDFYTFSDDNWLKFKNKQIDKLEHGQFISDRFNPGMVSFTFTSRGKNKVLVYIYFDLYKFYKDRVEEGLDPMMGNYELKWSFSLPENGTILNEETYRYSPFKSIKDLILENKNSWFLGISLSMEATKNNDNSTDKENRRIFFKPAPMNILSDNYSAYVDVYYDGKPLLYVKERYLTIQWLLNILLLSGLGISYFLILNQIRKLKIIRMKEKEFVASITHELRTPLAVIHSAADNIKSGIVAPSRMEQYGDLIIDQSKRLSSMIEGVLLFSRFEGKVEKSPILRQVETKLLKDSLLQIVEVVKKDYFLDLKLDLSLPDTFISDRVSLELILTNLILNCAKHGYNRGEKGVIRLKSHIKLPKYLLLIVEDDGCGISSKEKKHIFEPFFRGKNSHEKQINGSGLGLFLTSKKIKLLGGDIELQSPYERVDGKIRSGCRFIVSIPYIKADSEV